MDLAAIPSGTVSLRGQAVQLDSTLGHAFTADCARNTEGIMTDAAVKSKWGLTDDAWTALAQNEPLLQAVSKERQRRISSGLATIEAAHKQLTKAPGILGEMLSNDELSPRHRIEAARELRAIAHNDDSKLTKPTETFSLTINLGADEKLVFNKLLSQSDGPARAGGEE
jgi:hypothetical protein